MTRDDPVVVLTTVPVETGPDQLAEDLVVRRLAACVSVLPAMESVYRWQGAVERSAERQLLLKTTRARVPALRARLQTLHPYEVPEFLVLEVTGGDDPYLTWIRASVTARADET